MKSKFRPNFRDLKLEATPWEFQVLDGLRDVLSRASSTSFSAPLRLIHSGSAATYAPAPIRLAGRDRFG